MATKEDRYPKEYKPFPNDKPISSSQSSSNNMSNSGAGSSSSKQHSTDFKDTLKNTISRHMKGFRATNVITYKRFRDKSTWQRPGEFAELVATDDEDAFTADPKEAWPIMQDMNIDIPVRELTKQHRLVDRNWTVPVSTKKFKQPEPVYPQSTGVKLRNVEDIMNDYSKKAPPQAASNAPSLSLSTPSNASKTLTPTATNSIPRVADKSQRPLQLIPDKIKGVLQNLTDTRRKPSLSGSTTPAKSHGNTPSSNTPRKSSALKSSTITPQEPKIKKQSAPSTTTSTTTTTAKSANTQSRPRVSSKTIPMEKVTQIENIPDLMEARKYLIGHDEVEFRSLSSLQEMPKNAQVKERPQLYIRLYPKPDENDMPKGLKKHIASVNHIKIKQEKATSASSTKKNPAKATKHSKSTTSSTTTTTTTTSKPTLLPPSDPSTKSAGKSNIKKKSQSDQSQAPIRTSTPTTTTTTKDKPPIRTKDKGEEEAITAKHEKQAYSSSVSAEFLRSTKIPKRNNSIKSSFSSQDMELEEGETISPSPSPIRTKSRSSHAGLEDEGSSSNGGSNGGTERPPAPVSASRKLSTATAASSIPTQTSSKRRDEDKSSRERNRHRDESANSSSRRDRSRRRSRSRSPISRSHRSESKSRRSPSPPPAASSSSARRPTSSESSHRRRSPAIRSERESNRSERESNRSEKEGIPASITAVNATTSSRADKETASSASTNRADRSERDRESLATRETKRKSLHDASDSKSSTSEPPTKRLAATKTSSSSNNNNNKDDNKSSLTHTNTTPTTTIEKDTKYTSNSNPVSNSSSSTPKNVRKAAATTTTTAATTAAATTITTAQVANTPKSVSTPSTSSSISSSTTITAAHVPEKIVSATAPNAESPEQLKIFTIMFKQLAHANKRRGDHQKDPVIGIIDHFHALCDYMLNFYFIDKVNTNVPFKQASVAWKSLFPFSDSLLLKLQANHLDELYGLCVRLVALIRYYIYSRMESATRPLLTKHLSSGGSQDSSYTDRTCIEMTEGLLREHEKAEKCYKESEKYMTFGKVASQFPGTFKDVCIDGNILAGITLGGEAGVSVGPMFPFTPYSPLHHAAIVSKCILNEYVTKNNLNYSPISKPEEFM